MADRNLNDPLIPAKAGTQAFLFGLSAPLRVSEETWVPAHAGMSGREGKVRVFQRLAGS